VSHKYLNAGRGVKKKGAEAGKARNRPGSSPKNCQDKRGRVKGGGERRLMGNSKKVRRPKAP